MEVNVGDARELPLAGRDLDALMRRLGLPNREKESDSIRGWLHTDLILMKEKLFRKLFSSPT